jgi:hypothetical protein
MVPRVLMPAGGLAGQQARSRRRQTGLRRGLAAGSWQPGRRSLRQRPRASTAPAR